MTISIYVIITALGKVDLLFGNVAVNENKGLWRYDMEGQKFYGYMNAVAGSKMRTGS